jgi:hypothetical protein
MIGCCPGLRSDPFPGLECEKGEAGVCNPAPGKAQALGDPGRVMAAMQRVEDRSHESPDRIRGKPAGKNQQQHLAQSSTGNRHQALRLVDRLAPDVKCESKREGSHDCVEDAAGHASNALEKLQRRIRRRTLDGRVGLLTHR